MLTYLELLLCCFFFLNLMLLAWCRIYKFSIKNRAVADLNQKDELASATPQILQNDADGNRAKCLKA